jgi:oxygen-independent coproporphyrinogen-3 oxidase
MPGLYVHIPFCSSACPYCDFAFVVGKESQGKRYVDALTVEFTKRIGHFHPDTIDTIVDTIYFGGGTPSSIAPSDLARFLQTVRNNISIAPDAEVTAEANPNDHLRFAALREAGITRLSLGIQSTNDRTLKALGRTHTGRDAARAVKAARAAGFENLSVDTIFGCPSQTVAGWRTDLESVIALGPDHVSIYGLTIEPRTPFAKQKASGALELPVEDDQARMYDIALELTEQAGLEQYEISNFARTGFESRHNLACWSGDTYLGVGMSAHSYDGKIRSWNTRSLKPYLEQVERGESVEDGCETIGEDTRRIERVMLGLRTREGIDRILLGETTATSRLLSGNLIERAGERLRLTRRGKHIADLVCAELVRDL